jgi:VWFA-related protein
VVVCPATVVDKNGRYVTNLPKEAFTVSEDGVKQEIAFFKREDAPVSLGLVIDNSDSMRELRRHVKAAALALVKDSNPEDEVFVVNFNDEAYMDLPNGKMFTNDVEELEEALTRIDSSGGTALWDAIQMSLNHMQEYAKKEKKALVVVSDGVDNGSIVTQDDLLTAARQSDVLIYTVGLWGQADTSTTVQADHALKDLAAATGGEAFFPNTAPDTERIAHRVASDLRSQYTIEYRPSNTALDGRFRKIKIAVNAPGKLTVRTRNGYYAAQDR